MGKKRKKNKKNYGFEDEGAPVPEPVVETKGGFDGFEDVVEDEMQMTGKKKKKKKKKKKNFGFMDEHEDTPDEDDDDENDRFQKKTKKVLSKKDIREKQMNQTKEQIKIRQQLHEEARRKEIQLEQERKKLADLNKSRSRKKKKGGGFSTGAFDAMLAFSESEPEPEEEEAPAKRRTPTPPPVKKKEPTPPPKRKKKKKGKGKKGRKQQQEVEEDLDALLAGFNQGSPSGTATVTEEVKSEEVKKEPEVAASPLPAWALDFDEDDLMIFKKLLGKAKTLKIARRKLGASLDLEDDQVDEAWDMKDQILEEKKAAPPPPPKEPTPPPTPKVDLKKKRKREEQKRRQKLKKIRPRLDQSKAALKDVIKTTVQNMHKHYITFLENPENGYNLDVTGKLQEVIAPFADQIEEAFEQAQSSVKGDGVLFDETMKKLEGLMKGKDTWSSYRKLVYDTWKSLEADLKVAIEEWREEEKRLRLQREEEERLEKERLKKERKEQKKRKEAERKKMQAEQRRRDFEARFGVQGRGRGGGGAGKGRSRRKKSKFALAQEEAARREKEVTDAIKKEKEERERKRKEEEEKAKQLEVEKKRAEEAARLKRIADLKRYVQKKKTKKKDSDDDDSSSDISGSSDSDEVKVKKEKKKKKPSSSSDDESGSEDDSSSSKDSESELETSSEEDFSDASDESVVVPVKPPPKPKPKPQASSSTSSKDSPAPREENNKAKKPEKAKKGKKKLSKKEKRALKEQKQKERLKNLRAPIGCIMGHVDAGKTLILDNIRKSKVAEGESGGITQQIGATFLPRSRLQEHLEKCKKTFKDLEFHLPGILMIDTPGHAAFHNMRTRGSNLCDIAIVAVDIFDADRSKLQPTTVEALKMLTNKKTPFVIAMNKIDMINGWEVHEDSSFVESYAKQSARVKQLLEGYLSKVKLRFAEEGHNVEIYSRNKNKKEYISLVPTSAFTGEGIADILCLLSELCQNYMAKGLQFVSDQVRGSVLETKKMVGIGNVCDVILANGELRAGDEIVLGGLNGAFVTKIKSILLPATLQEMRVKGEYKTVASVTAAAGVRIQAPNLEHALAGSKILVVDRELKKDEREKEIDRLLDQVDGEMETLAYDYIDPSGVGVFLQANTLGAMEALLEIVKMECDIPISGIRLGDISKADVMKASVANEKGRPEYACILGFMVQCPRDVELQAEASKVTIFQSDVIYRLQLEFQEYLEDQLEQRKLESADEVVFPVEMEILPKYIIHAKKPVVIGCRILRGMLRIGTPVISMQHDGNGLPAPFYVGVVDSIQKEQKDIDKADMGDEVAVRFNSGASEVVVTYGRHFDHKDKLVSQITRGSLNKLKDLHADEIKEDQNSINLIHLLKNYFDII